MALEFISPKKRKKVLIRIIIGVFVFSLALFGVLVFFRPPEPDEVEKIFVPEEVEISFEMLKSEKIENLELFETEVKKTFFYEAETEEEEIREGKKLAFSKEEVKEKIREELGEVELVNIEIEEKEIGRNNPFILKEIVEEKEEAVEEEIEEMKEEFEDNPRFQELLTEIEENPRRAQELLEEFKELVEEETEEVEEEIEEETEEQF